MNENAVAPKETWRRIVKKVERSVSLEKAKRKALDQRKWKFLVNYCIFKLLLMNKPVAGEEEGLLSIECEEAIATNCSAIIHWPNAKQCITTTDYFYFFEFLIYSPGYGLSR